MTAFTYTAKDRGELIQGHSELTEYSFDAPVAGWNKSSSIESSTKRSLSGKRVTTFHNLLNLYSVTTSPLVDPIEIANMRELLSSVVAGESFSIDVYGSVLSADAPKNFKLQDAWSESLNPQTNEITFEFRVEQA